MKVDERTEDRTALWMTLGIMLMALVTLATSLSVFLQTSAVSASPTRTIESAPVAYTVTKADLAPLPLAVATSTAARAGEGVIRITTRICGNANTWQAVAASNGIRPPVYLVLLGQTLLVSCSGGSAPAQAPAAASGAAQRIVNYALAQVGKSYRWGAAGPWSFDCSGLVQQALAQAGVYVPHQDQAILYSGKGHPVSRGNLQPGDIVWPHVGHVMIYIGNGQVVHAAGRTRGVIKSSLYGFMAARRYV